MIKPPVSTDIICSDVLIHNLTYSLRFLPLSGSILAPHSSSTEVEVFTVCSRCCYEGQTGPGPGRARGHPG